MIKIYRQNDYIAFEFSPDNKAAYSKDNKYLIQVTAVNYISIYTFTLPDYDIQAPYQILRPTHYSLFAKENGDPLGSDVFEVFNLLSQILIAGQYYKYFAQNYSELIAQPSAQLYDLAYVRDSQGTAWMPGPIGGTFYDKGTYMYNGSQWVSDRNAIDAAMQDMINAVILKADSTDPRFPASGEKQALAGTFGAPGSVNKYVTDTDPRNSNARTPLTHTHVAADITESSVRRFITDAERIAWNAKQNALGFTPENIANKGAASGYAQLDVNTLLPLALLTRGLQLVLQGISFVTNTPVIATDTIIIAFGKIQGQLNSFLPTSDQKNALAGNNGLPSATNKYVTESGLAAAFTQAGAAVTRALNTVASTGFLVSAAKYSYVRYVLSITCSVSLSGSQSGDVFIEIAPTGTVAGGAWTILDQAGFSWAGGLVIGLTLNPTLKVSLAGFVPPNYDVRLRFSGTGTGAYVSGRENILN